MLKLSKFVFKC